MIIIVIYRKKEEKERQHQLQIQEEMRRVALEEERKRMHQVGWLTMGERNFVDFLPVGEKNYRGA